MSVVVTIEGTDRSSSIETRSLRWTQNLTNKVDTLSFDIVSHETFPFTLSLLDDIVLTVDSTDVFGGRVISWKDSVESRGVLRRTVTCKDYTADLDKFLFSGTYTAKPLYNIIKDVLHTVNKRDETRIRDMETDETWSAGSADTTNYREGDQSRKVAPTSTTYSESNSATTSTLDLSSRTYIEFDYYVYDSTLTGGVRVKLGNSGLTAYYSYEITSGFSTGWNHARVLKTAFSSTGSPSWAAIAKVAVAAKSSSATTSYVSFDDLYATDSDAFTMDGVDVSDTLTIESATFVYKTASDVLKKLAALVAYDWQISADKDLSFFDSQLNTAPIELQDSNDTYVYESLELSSDISQLRNVVYIFGGDVSEDSTKTEVLDTQANGTNKIFQIGYRYKTTATTDYSLTVNSVSKTVGIDGVDDSSSFDAMYNPDEKTLEFTTAPASAATVRFTGYRLYPLAEKIGDSVSILTYGEHEMVIKDEDINTTDAALQRAIGEFVAYADSIVDGSFDTDETGLEAGMKIHVTSTVRDVDEWYVIQRVTGKMRTPDDMRYSIQLVSSKTYGMVEILQKLLAERVKEIDDYDDFHLLSAAYEVVEVTDSTTVSTGYEYTDSATADDDYENWASQPMSWVAGNYAVSNTLWNTTDLTRTPCADGGATLAS